MQSDILVLMRRSTEQMKDTFGKPNISDSPCLILHGSADDSVDFEDSEKLSRRLGDAGVENVLYKMDGLGHIFTTRYEEMLNQTATFLYKALTGAEKEISVSAGENPEWTNVKIRQNSKIVYNADQDNTSVAVVTDGNTRRYEIAIDLNGIDKNICIRKDNVSMKTGDTIGFSICYNDSDNGSREYQVGWTAGKSSDRKTLGNLVFVEKSIAVFHRYRYNISINRENMSVRILMRWKVWSKISCQHVH